MVKRLVIASDHGGFELKEHLRGALKSPDLEIIDLGVNAPQSVDYPDCAERLCLAVQGEKAEVGILLCGTGIGMSIAANRHVGIRAALCTDPYMARMSRAHNNANVLVLGGRIIGPSLAEEIVRTFLNSDFEGGRHERRLAKIDAK